MHLVLTTPRSGSTWFCTQLANQHNSLNLDEYFHDRYKEYHKIGLRSVIKNTKCVIKLFPNHIETSVVPNLLEECIRLSTSITFLVRKDFNSQVQSYYVAKELRMWGENSTTSVYATLDENAYNMYQESLFDQILKLSNYYKTITNSTLVFLEELSSTGKYKRQVFWDKHPKHIDINIAKLFEK